MAAGIDCCKPALRGWASRTGLALGYWVLASALDAASPALVEASLAQRSQPASRAMFTPMLGSKTGIQSINHYSDPGMWAERYQELAYGAMGTGVAVGDYDGDGKPDLFVVSKTGTSRLFRNLGNWKFEDATEQAGLLGSGDAGLAGTIRSFFSDDDADAETERSNWTQGAAFADVNNDGRLDLYVCRFAAPNQLFINQGDGAFREEAQARGLALADASGMAAFCDYDRDGWLDVYVQTSLLSAAKSPAGQPDRLYRNVGDGRFEEVTASAGIAGESMGHSATWWDYDGDGWPDLYVANDYAVPDKLYRNNRNGTFSNVIDSVVPHTSYYSMGADLGDVNNDGLIDLVVGDMAATSRTKDLRGMAGSRARAQLVPDESAAAPQLMRNALYVNTGAGRMLEAANLAGFPATDWTWSVRFEDLDNDGRLDLHVTNGMSREYHNADLLDRIMALENPADSRRLMKELPPFAERNLVYRNLGDLNFEEVGERWGLGQIGVSFGAAFGDFDGDGDLDLVFANYDAAPTVLRNDSTEGHRVIVALRGGTSNRFGVGATVRLETAGGTQVRQLVLARGYLSSSEPVLHFGLGRHETIERLVVEWPSGQVQEFAALKADRRYTISEPEGPAKPASAREMAGPLFSEESEARGLALRSEETFHAEQQPLSPTRFDRRGPALAVADFDGDGRDEVVLGGVSGKPTQILKRSGERFAPWATLPGSALDDGPLLAFDANGDGRADLLQTRAGANRPMNSPDYQPVLHLNQGNGRFEAAQETLPALPISAGAVAAADFNRDGRLDVFLGGRNVPGRYPSAPHSALLVNGGGRFEDITDAVAPTLREAGMVTAALWSDVDRDGWPDLVVALEWGGLRFWRNDRGERLLDESQAAGFTGAGSGWWTSLASADFNHDGRLDFVAGNTGLNTPYRAPALLFVGRFGAGGPPQLVEAVSEGGKLQPLRSRTELVARVPALARRFPKNDDYAQASLQELLGAERLAAAERFEATELQSGVLLSQPDGRYRFAALPRIAQVAPLQGIVTGDLDADGHADIYAVQNSWAPVPSIGPFAGGVSQLLKGDGRGGFAPVPARESGLVVPGDAKAAVMLELDGDGWPDLLVSRNNATALAWRNHGEPGRKSFRIELRGSRENQAAIGAWIEVLFADGTRRSSEVHAGSSYYSQSGAGCFFGFAEGNPPRRVIVHWPNGQVTERELSAPIDDLLVISAE